MPTRQELILQFMYFLSANASTTVGNASQVYQLACNLADEYLKNQG